jgi:hypothetical protein
MAILGREDEARDAVQDALSPPGKLASPGTRARSTPGLEWILVTAAGLRRIGLARV